MKNYFFGLLAIVIAFGASAFTSNQKIASSEANNKLATQNWYFKVGEPLSNARKEASYQTSSPGTCDAADEVPCQISFEADQYLIPTSKTPLQNYLDAHGSDNAVLTDAVQTRSE